MGFFSWNCHRCDKSIRSIYSIGRGEEWLIEAVAITEKKQIFMGTYDGYGRLDGEVGTIDLQDLGVPITMYHRTCWTLDGKPVEFKGESNYANDQGFFIEFDEEEEE